MTPDRVDMPASVTPLGQLALALAAVEAAADAIEEDAPLADLAAVAELLDQVTSKARTARELLNGPLSWSMGDKVVREGQFELEARQGAKRRNWQSVELLGEVARRAQYDPETGESLAGAGSAAFQRLHVLVSRCLPITPSTGWKTTGLRDAGIEPDEWHEWAPGRVTVLVRRIDPDGVVETEDAA